MNEYGNQSMNGPGSASGAPGPQQSVAPPGIAGGTLEAPMDGCVPGSPLKRILGAVIDAVIANIVLIPLYIGVTLLAVNGEATLLAQILIGVGVALPVAYAVVVLWLHGSKGFTLGKLSVGLRTARMSTSQPIGFLRALGRAVLYGIIPLIMALSVFLDPKKLLRGFHDRAIDSVVVDVKTGQHPFQERPDTFDRPGVDHYMPDAAVAVATHDNLMAEPGSAWQDQGRGSAPAAHSAPSAWDPVPSQPAQDQPVQSWGSAPSAASQTSASSAPVDSWAPPPSHGGYSEQPPGAGPPQDAPPQYGAPMHSSAPEQASPFGAPAAPSGYGAPEQSGYDVQDPSSQGFGSQPPAQADWAAPAPKQPLQADAPVAEETSGANWEETQRTGSVPAPDDEGDIEQTRLSAVAPAVTRIQTRLVLDDGAEISSDIPVVLGRNPSSQSGEKLFVVKDETRSLSKTHLRVDGTGEDIVVTDLGSTNGSAIIREDGGRETLVPNTATVLPRGAQLAVGDRVLSLERDQ